MGLRELWGRLLGDRDRLEREDDAIRNAGPDGPAPLEDYEGVKDDVEVKELDFAGAEAAEEDEEATDGPA
ncbi:MAG TPA: hypothetical protein VFU10_04680 [Gaiellaceae bacterium]|nr:hypothetical protein [Gaiellaceae bacterium]